MGFTDYSKRDLVKITEQVPEKVALTEKRLAAITEEHQQRRKEMRGALVKGQNFLWGTKYGLLGTAFMLPFVAYATPGALLLFMMCGLVGTSMAALEPLASVDNHRAAQRLTDWTYGRLREEFRNSQEELFTAKQKALIDLAEAELGDGRLLDEKTLSYLAVIPPHMFKEASEQLAVSVLQARSLLAYHRCSQKHEDGEKQVKKPLSFARLSLDPTLPVHRTMLHEKLARVYNRLAEDDYPEYEELDVQTPDHRPGFFGHLGRWLANPLFTSADMKRYGAEIKLPDAVPVKPLIVAEDFAAALRTYEREVEPLDLPALRGWPEKPARLASRQRPTLPRP